MIYIVSQKFRYLGINFKIKVKDQFTEKYKLFLKLVIEDTKNVDRSLIQGSENSIILMQLSYS